MATDTLRKSLAANRKSLAFEQERRKSRKSVCVPINISLTSSEESEDGEDENGEEDGDDKEDKEYEKEEAIFKKKKVY